MEFPCRPGRRVVPVSTGRGVAPPRIAMSTTDDLPMELGVQPLDGIIRALGVDNHALVEASSAPLTHKMVMKGRRGRRLTRKIQERIVAALNQLGTREEAYRLDELFTYRGR